MRGKSYRSGLIVAMLAALLAVMPTNTALAESGGGDATSQTAMGQIDGGQTGTCSIDNGEVWCWGGLGNGSIPELIDGITTATSITVGSSHACALLTNGSITCFGNNTYGQLGDGNTSGAQFPPTPVTGITNAVEVSAGASHTCAVLANGTARCWGRNNDGQLGDGTNTNRALPTAVSGITDAVKIAGGSDHTCIVPTSGTPKCWGRNLKGQLGNGSLTSSTTPVDVLNITIAVAITAGLDHTCALLSNGKILCWGEANQGQLGYGDFFDLDRPAFLVSGISNAVGISAGNNHTCAVLSGGGARCWGFNGQGQVGNGSSDEFFEVPAVVAGVGNATAITAGSQHNCVLRTNGNISCWGDNGDGQLGNGEPTYRTTQTVIQGLAGVEDIAPGSNHTCASLTNGQARCWGSGSSGQLGNGGSSSAPTPAAVTGIGNASGIDVAFNHSCAARDNGGVACWGSGSSGQLGNGSTSSNSTPVAVSALGNATDVATGSAFSCALRTTGSVACWGSGSFGQLGNGSTANTSTPGAVSGISDATQITTGRWHACALRSNGSIRCWGYNSNGQLGNGSTTDSSTPVAVAGIGNAVAVSAGLSHTCALLDNGRVKCWGSNFAGVLGDGSASSSSFSPVLVSGVVNAVDIGAGDTHTCAVQTGGTVKCWGQNRDGQLGDGTTVPKGIPSQVLTLNNAIEVEAGSAHTCAIRAARTVVCWGNNRALQLGIGEANTERTPVLVDFPDQLSVLNAPCVLGTGTLNPGQTATEQVSGECGLPATGVSAAVLSLQAINPTGVGNLRISAAGTTPTGGVVNYHTNGLDNANTITVPLSSSGEVDISVNGSRTNYRLVVIGHYHDGGSLRFTPITPCAVADSRPTLNPAGNFVGPFTVGSNYPDIKVEGAFSTNQGGNNTNCGIPTSATAVMLNVISVSPQGGSGGLALGIGGTNPVRATTPFASIGLNNAATTIVKPAANGRVALNITGDPGASTHVRVVALGYFRANSGDTYTPLTPCVAFDTRESEGGTGSFVGKRRHATPTSYRTTSQLITQGGRSQSCGASFGATAVLINLVSIQPEAVGNLRAYATGTNPTGGVLNFNVTSPTMNNSNAVVVPLDSSGRISVEVNAPGNAGNPTTHVRGVILGYYS